MKKILFALIGLIIFSSCKTYYYANSCGDSFQGKKKESIKKWQVSNCGTYKFYSVQEGKTIIFSGVFDTINFKMKTLYKMPLLKRMTSGKILSYKIKKLWYVVKAPYVFVAWLFSPEAKDW